MAEQQPDTISFEKDRCAIANLRSFKHNAMAATFEIFIIHRDAVYAEQAAWARWAPPDVERPEGRTWWRPRHPGFRAMLRLSVALRRLEQADGRVIEPTPESVERLYAADIHFLDLLYWHACAANAPIDATVACQKCSTSFLPAL